MMVRKQVYLAPEQEAKLKRLARATGRSEAEIIREALDALPESPDPVLDAAGARGCSSPRRWWGSPAQADAAYRRYLQRIGRRQLGLSQAVLAERKDRGVARPMASYFGHLRPGQALRPVGGRGRAGYGLGWKKPCRCSAAP